MSSREKILSAIGRNKPGVATPSAEASGAPLPGASTPGAEAYPLPVLPLPHSYVGEGLDRFCTVLQMIGGEAVRVPDMDAIRQYVEQHYNHTHRIVTTLPELSSVAELQWPNTPPHELANVELALLRGHFGVAENGSIWVTESLLEHRAAPYICQQLALIINNDDIVPTMHEAYTRIGNATYGYGTFIAGPSKTADIEQSLVLGAHGPKGMIAFVVG